MINDTITYQNGKISKLLLSIALFFGVFSYSGYSINYQSKLVQAVKTELVVKNNASFKRCVSYKSLIKFFSRNDFSRSYLSFIILELSSLHTNLTAVNLEIASKQFHLQDQIPYWKKVSAEPKSDEYLLS